MWIGSVRFLIFIRKKVLINLLRKIKIILFLIFCLFNYDLKCLCFKESCGIFRFWGFKSLKFRVLYWLVCEMYFV